MIGQQFAQELLSTFGDALGEVALQPSTGGTFIVSLYSSKYAPEIGIEVQHHVLWDRKAEGGFPGVYFCFPVHLHGGSHCLAAPSQARICFLYVYSENILI
jgi:hypothetical protein